MDFVFVFAYILSCLCPSLVSSFSFPVDNIGEFYDNYTINGWTAPICTRSGLCNTNNETCYSYYNTRGGCHCDSYCFYFNDCCIDYLQDCRTDVFDEPFSRATEGIDPSQFTCMMVPGIPQYPEKYLMVGRCDPRWLNEQVRTKCEDRASIEDPLTYLPVEYLKNITFKNVYCAVCNFKGINGITPWGVEATCENEELANIPPEGYSAQQIGEIISDCIVWSFDTSFSSTSKRRCQSPVINSCNVDAQYESLVLLARACDSYTDIIEIYKNPHCFICHNYLVNNLTMEEIYLNLIYMWCPPRTTSGVIITPDFPYPNYPISVLFDFTSVDGLFIAPCEDHQIFDQVNKICIDLICPSGYELMNGTCHGKSVNSQCFINNTFPFLVEVECSDHVEVMSGCHPNSAVVDYIRTAINESYPSSTNLRVSRFLAEIHGDQSSNVCVQSLELWGYVDDGLDTSKENLDDILLPRNQSSSTRKNLCDNLTVRISIGCQSLNKTCTHGVIFLDDFSMSFRNTTGQTFSFGETVYPLSESLFVITYDIISTGTISKQEHVTGCQGLSENCALVPQNVSLFVDLDNGSYLYSPLNRTVMPNEVLVENDTVFICSYVLQSMGNTNGFLSFTPAQSIISTIGLALSVIALVLTFVTYLKFNLLRKATSNALIMSLCITLSIAQCVILFSGLASMISTLCLSFAIVGHFMWMAAFSHTTALAFDLHRRFGIASRFGPTDEGVAVLKRFFLFVWGCPIFVVLPCLIIYFSDANTPGFNFTYGTVACWIGDGMANLYVFGIPVAVLVLVNLILFIMVVAGLHRMRRSPVQKQKSQESKVSSDLWIYIKMSTLLGFTWLFGFIAGFADVAALWYIFIILNSLQGVYIFVAFVCNKRVLKLWRDSCRCRVRTPLTSSSKSRGTSSDVVSMTKSKGGMTDSESML